MANSNQVIFSKGKEKALKTVFSDNNFGYLAIGYDPEEQGFVEPDDGDIAKTNFKELTSSDYHRIELKAETTEIDPDTNKVLVKFSGNLEADNIQGQRINQMAIVDNLDITGETTYFSATTFPTFNKTSNSSITFMIGMRL